MVSVLWGRVGVRCLRECDRWVREIAASTGGMEMGIATMAWAASDLYLFPFVSPCVPSFEQDYRQADIA